MKPQEVCGRKDAMIEVQHLTKRYGTHKAVDDLSFTAEPGRIYGFLGPNGAGKSTTMNIMTGYLAATDGSVLMDGIDIQKEPEKAKRKIGYLPEVPPVYTDMTVLEYLRFAADLKGVRREEREDAVRNVLDATGILDVPGRLIRNLSKGYRQRVGLAQALIGNPDIQILDEPTSGLDPEQQKEMFDYLKTLRKDHTIILSSHILSDVSAVADVVWILNEGKLVASDKPENLQSRMTTSQRVTLRVKGSRKELEAALRAVPKVTGVSAEEKGEELIFTITSDSGDDICPAVSRAAVYAGAAVLGMNREEKSLEDVFLSLTGRGTPDMKKSSSENADEKPSEESKAAEFAQEEGKPAASGSAETADADEKPSEDIKEAAESEQADGTQEKEESRE